MSHTLFMTIFLTVESFTGFILDSLEKESTLHYVTVNARCLGQGKEHCCPCCCFIYSSVLQKKKGKTRRRASQTREVKMGECKYLAEIELFFYMQYRTLVSWHTEIKIKLLPGLSGMILFHSVFWEFITSDMV